MRLDTSLKLYMVLYVLCFALTWLVSVPMLVHVMPRSECLLFVDRWMKYGPPAGKEQKNTIKRAAGIGEMKQINLLLNFFYSSIR